MAVLVPDLLRIHVFFQVPTRQHAEFLRLFFEIGLGRTRTIRGDRLGFAPVSAATRPAPPATFWAALTLGNRLAGGIQRFNRGFG